MRVLAPIGILVVAVAAMVLMVQQGRKQDRAEMEVAHRRLLQVLDHPEGENLEGRLHDLCDTLLRSPAGREKLQVLGQEREDLAYHAGTRGVYFLVHRWQGGKIGLNAVIHGEDPDFPHAMAAGYPDFVVLDRIAIEGDELLVNYHWSTAPELKYLTDQYQLTPGEHVQVRVPVVEEVGDPITAESLGIPGY